MATKYIPGTLNLNLGDRPALVQKISPTFISSDLHSPNQRNRITAPSLGLQKRKQSEPNKSWGENLLNYGGIGNQPFNGKVRVRDLFVSRNQKHFSSGFSKYETNVQPYMLTAFKYSGCRQNDQVLPAVFKIGLNPKYTPNELIVFDGSPIIPYFSHNSKFEVFPRHDEQRKHKGTNDFVLTERTRKALRDYYEDLYELPYNGTTYPDHMSRNTDPSKIFQSDIVNKDEQKLTYCRMIPFLSHLCILSGNGADENATPLKKLLDSYVIEMSNTFSDVAYEEFCNVVKALDMYARSGSTKELGISLKGYHLNTVIAILESNCTCQKKVEQIKELLDSIPFKGETLNTVIDNDNFKNSIAKQINDWVKSKQSEEQCRVKGAEPLASGVSPCWPPSSSYTLDLRTLQLQSTGSLPQGTDESNTNKPLKAQTKHRLPSAKPLKSHVEKEPPYAAFDESVTGPGLPEYKSYINSVIPTSFDERGIVQPDVQYFPENPAMPKPKPEYDVKDHIGYDKLVRKTYLPPISLSDALPAAGNRIQDRLGLRFMTEAHKRFHALYPDPIPDLRDNINYRKRHFFNGYHTSALRG